jgi:hypothetical protein
VDLIAIKSISISKASVTGKKYAFAIKILAHSTNKRKRQKSEKHTGRVVEENTQVESPFGYQLQVGVCGEKETRKSEGIGTILSQNERQTIHIKE